MKRVGKGAGERCEKVVDKGGDKLGTRVGERGGGKRK